MAVSLGDITAWKQATPFRPFYLVLTTGKRVGIDRPEGITLHGKSTPIWAEDSEGRLHTLNIESIAGIEPKPSRDEIERTLKAAREGKPTVTLDQIRKAHRREPFEPFFIHLADGRTLEVPHPEFLYIPPRGERCVFVSDDQGVVEAVDLLLVVSLKPMSSSQRRRKAG